MPPTNRSRPQEGQGPVQQLLSHTREILELERRLHYARILRRFARFGIVVVPLGILAVYAATYLTYRKVDLKIINIPAIPILVLLGIYLAVYYFNAVVLKEPSLDVPQIELELELAQERRRLYAVALNLDLETRQLIYRDSVPQDVEQFRSESKYYRRIHNALQAIIIIGALAASTLTGLLQSVPQLRWFAVGTTFAVGVAAGFTGYFKFRERSFYLQQTSDSIEQELNAVGLRIGRYKNKSESDALTEFTEQIEILKIEQRKRQQQLEQPSEGREGVQ